MKKVVIAAALVLAGGTAALAQDTADQAPGLSGATTPATPDCQSTANQPVLLIRNLIEGTTVTGILCEALQRLQ